MKRNKTRSITTSSPVESLDTFLTFLRRANSEYNACKSLENSDNDATQDILHYIELEDHTYHDYAKLSKALKQIREDRREAKSTMEILGPIVEWAHKNERVVKDLEAVLGTMRKIERYSTNKHYNYKTSIVQDTMGDNI